MIRIDVQGTRTETDAFVAEFGDTIREFLASHGGGRLRSFICEEDAVEPAEPSELNAP